MSKQVAERKFLIAAAVILSALIIGFLVQSGIGAKAVALLPESGVSRARQTEAAWQQYKVDQECHVTGNTQTHIEYHRIGLLSFSDTVTEYEWKCRGGDTHWTREPEMIPPQPSTWNTTVQFACLNKAVLAIPNQSLQEKP